MPQTTNTEPLLTDDAAERLAEVDALLDLWEKEPPDTAWDAVMDLRQVRGRGKVAWKKDWER